MGTITAKTSGPHAGYPQLEFDDTYFQIVNGVVTLSIPVIPTGTIIPYSAETPPAGWLECDGSNLPETTYPELFAVIGTNFGAGSGPNEFNLPDLRGVFIRGWANASSLDPDKDGRIESHPGSQTGNHVGSYQADTMQEITGSLASIAGASVITGNTGAMSDSETLTPGTISDASPGTQGTTIDFKSSNSPGTRTSTETRSKNLYLMYIIKT